MSSCNINSVAILNSIPEGELQGALRLREDLEDLQFGDNPTPGVWYRRVWSKEDLLRALDDLTTSARASRMRPVVHLECHGSREGLQTANGDLIPWHIITSALIALNVATELNLLAVLACCYGAYLPIALNLTGRAPVWGLIGPVKEVTAGRLEEDFRRFYRTMATTRQAGEALEQLDQESGSSLYYRETAQSLFLLGWKGYKEAYCTPEAMDRRALGIQKDLITAGTPYTLDDVRTVMENSERPLFEKYRDQYFMVDLFPNHLSRFEVNYEAIQSALQVAD